MPRADDQDSAVGIAAGATIADMLFPLSNPLSRTQLEDFRLSYEKAYGPTDLTKRYTSTWPRDQQSWLLKYQTKMYFEGLPSFAKAWIKGKLMGAAEAGTLDDMPENFLRLFAERELDLDPPKRGFRGW